MASEACERKGHIPRQNTQERQCKEESFLSTDPFRSCQSAIVGKSWHGTWQTELILTAPNIIMEQETNATD